MVSRPASRARRRRDGLYRRRRSPRPLATEPPTPKALSWTECAGRGSRTEVNEFLEGDVEGAEEHALGGVEKWTAAFQATYAGYPQAVAVVAPPYNASHNGTGRITLTRLSTHPNAPANTSSWVIARLREWAASRDYDQLVTYSGVDGNEGICYEAAGMEPAGDPVERDGAAWESSDEIGTWERQKWVCPV